MSLKSIVGGAVGFAVGGPAGAAIGAGIGSSADQASAIKAGTNAQVAAANQANDTQRYIFERGVQLQQPFYDAGITAQNRLLDLLGLSKNTSAQGFGSLTRDFGAQDFQADPGYQFRLAEGQKAIERAGTAKGNLYSGRALRDFGRFNQGTADQAYGDAFNRFQVNRANKLNPLQALLGQSQSAAGQMNQSGQNFANQFGQNLGAAANAQAAGGIGRASAYGNAINQGFNIYQQNQLLNQLGGGGFSAPSFGGGGYFGGIKL